ncbi:type IV conjugative transfer system protein TraL [uncultured Thiodictyon sp.]|jgi:hypothetical protein|uniref:type IV conjugative transfer system protein TraL n=1 Tax=uncultured Thiodictyon sp. TaxID=1846217 RepID=UPI00345941CF
MADPTEIPKCIDDPPLILLWRVDDLVPIVLCLVIGIFISRDPASGTIYITGTHVTSGPAAKPVNTSRTYALRVEFKNYRPVVVFLDSYPGEPRVGATDGSPR